MPSGPVTNGSTWTHTPVATPAGVICWTVANEVSDNITDFDYGGTSLADISMSPLFGANLGIVVHGYFLGSAVPTGAQTVTVTRTAGTLMSAGCITLTAAGDTEINSVDIIDVAATSNPSDTILLGGVESFVAFGGAPGFNNSGNTTPLTDWTMVGEHDLGSHQFTLFRYDLIGTSDVTWGYTSGSDSHVLFAASVNEVASGNTPLRRRRN